MIGAPLLSSIRVSLVRELSSGSSPSLGLSITTWYLPMRLRAPVTHNDGGSGGGATPNRVRFNRSFFFLVGSRRWDGSISVYSSSPAWYVLMRSGKVWGIRLQSKLSVVAVSCFEAFYDTLRLAWSWFWIWISCCKIPRAHFFGLILDVVENWCFCFCF